MSQTLLHPTRGQENQGYDFQAIPRSRSSIATSGYDLQYIDSPGQPFMQVLCWRERGNKEATQYKMAMRRKRRFRHEDGTRRRNVCARRTVRQEETFPPEGRYGRKRRFRPKDGTTERGVSTTRMVRRGRSRFHHENGAEKKKNASTTTMVRRREARFHHKDGTKKKDSSQQTIIGYVC